MKAVIYARVSSREQEQEGYSIPAQLKLLHDYASRNGFEIAEEFVDIETAKTTGRKRFGEMVDFLKRSRNGRVVLVEKPTGFIETSAMRLRWRTWMRKFIS